MSATAIQHGTYGAYWAHGCRCPECRRADASYKALERKLRDLRLEGQTDSLDHGQRNTYVNWNCRCDGCVEANAQWMRDYRRRRAAA